MWSWALTATIVKGDNLWFLLSRHVIYITKYILGPLWSLLYGSWIYNYMCNQCLLQLKLWVQIPLRQGVLDTTLCDKVCQWLAAGKFSQGIPVSSNKTDRHDITEILLKVALYPITPAPPQIYLPYKIIQGR